MLTRGRLTSKEIVFKVGRGSILERPGIDLLEVFCGTERSLRRTFIYLFSGISALSLLTRCYKLSGDEFRRIARESAEGTAEAD